MADEDVPASLQGLRVADVEKQRVEWSFSGAWRGFLSARPKLAKALVNEVAEQGGIRRKFVHGYADGDPIDLFYAAMAWGYGTTNVRFPAQRALLKNPPKERIASVVQLTRTAGAEAGWHAFRNRHKIGGLDYAFGAKILYFAAYHLDVRPRPLILDLNVLLALHEAGSGILAGGRVFRADYMEYLRLGELWSHDPVWDGSPEVVELGLFRRGRQLSAAAQARRRRYGNYVGPE